MILNMNMKLLSYRDILTKIFYFGIKRRKKRKMMIKIIRILNILL
jgi:hypothetical protein